MNGKNKADDKRATEKSKPRKPPVVTPDDSEIEDGDIATPKFDRDDEDLEP